MTRRRRTANPIYQKPISREEHDRAKRMREVLNKMKEDEAKAQMEEAERGDN